MSTLLWSDAATQNLEYARTLLLRLEHSSSSIKLPSRKQAAQSDLFAQRALIKRLTDRLHDLEAEGDDDDHLHGPEDEEDILGDDKPSDPVPAEEPDPLKPPVSGISEAPSTLRKRHQPSRALLTTADPSSTNQADVLAHNDTETANLTSSLFTLAEALKASSTQFSASLATDTETLTQATDGLDKNATGMEAAGKRIGLLKRMSEGKGWWGRIMLYAWIGGLWVVAILLVFVGPKLRF